jgi:hypothetical protein
MMDRLVCADGGNPDPSTTHGKDALRAKQIELDGWSYPKHLARRAFAVVAHGDAAGTGGTPAESRGLLTDMGLVQAGTSGVIDTFIGYYQPYATSHDDLDETPELFEEVRNAARSLMSLVSQIRSGAWRAPDEGCTTRARSSRAHSVSAAISSSARISMCDTFTRGSPGAGA